MKVRCIQDCNGLGYENFKKGQEREIQEHLANVLIEFKYAESIEPAKDPKREALIKQFKDLGLIGEAEKMDTEIIEDCIKTHLEVLEKAKLAAEEKLRLEAAGKLQDENGKDIILPAGNLEDPPHEIKKEETEEEKKARLVLRAKELEIKGVLSNFGIETLEKKIAEAEANL